MNTFENLRIPTLLGLFVLIAGISAGVYLTAQNQSLNSKAASESLPKNITVTNITDQGATISWQTDSSVSGFVTFGTGSTSDQTALDDRDQDNPVPKITHHVSLSNLTPETNYQFKVFSGKLASNPASFTTAKLSSPNGLKPITGSVLEGDKTISGGVIFLEIPGALTQSAAIKNLGNFILPLSQIRKKDFSSVLIPELGTKAKLTVYSQNLRVGTATFILDDSGKPLPPLKLGQDLSFTESSLGVPTSKPANAFELLQQKTINH